MKKIPPNWVQNNDKTQKNTTERPDQAAVKILKLFCSVFLVLLVTVGGTVVYYLLVMDLPGIDALKDYRPSIASRVLDENGD